MTITEFLMARIAEDATAQDDPAEWSSDQWHRADCEVNTHTSGPCDCGLPAHVLAECEAKRQIVKGEQRSRAKQDAPEHGRGWDGFEEFISLPNGAEIRGDALDAFITAWYEPSPPSRVLRLLALPYAYHEDFREEWRVS